MLRDICHGEYFMLVLFATSVLWKKMVEMLSFFFTRHRAIRVRENIVVRKNRSLIVYEKTAFHEMLIKKEYDKI